MTKKQNKMKQLVSYKPIYFLILAVVTAIICLFALRSNNEHMITLRNDVYSADKNDTNVSLALQKLQSYVTRHMNTNLAAANGIYPPIQLKYTYQRILNQESSTAANSNATLYTDAQNYCQQVIPGAFSGRTRVPCIEQYVQSHDSNLPTVPTELYEFDFISPSWSPDLAGWTLVIAIASFLIFVVSLSVDRFLNRLN